MRLFEFILVLHTKQSIFNCRPKCCQLFLSVLVLKKSDFVNFFFSVLFILHQNDVPCLQGQNVPKYADISFFFCDEA